MLGVDCDFVNDVIFWLLWFLVGRELGIVCVVCEVGMCFFIGLVFEIGLVFFM